MKQCGECTLCCKIPKIAGLKPSDQWCKNCIIGKGCAIYDHRPKVCQDFACRWLSDQDMPDAYRPDRVHFYVAPGNDSDEVFRVRVDTDYPEAWKDSPIVEAFLNQGKHVVVSVGWQITFLAGRGRPTPEKLVLEWIL